MLETIVTIPFGNAGNNNSTIKTSALNKSVSEFWNAITKTHNTALSHDVHVQCREFTIQIKLLGNILGMNCSITSKAYVQSSCIKRKSNYILFYHKCNDWLFIITYHVLKVSHTTSVQKFIDAREISVIFCL